MHSMRQIVTAWGAVEESNRAEEREQRFGYARIWDAATAKPLTEPMKHDAEVRSAQSSPDGKLIVTASGLLDDVTGEARVWDTESGRPVTAPMKHTAPVRSAQFSPDSKRIVTASIGLVARVWDARTGKPLTANRWEMATPLWGTTTR